MINIRKATLGWMILILIMSGCDQLPLLGTLVEPSSKNSVEEAALWDDFSDKKSGWDQVVSSEGSAGYFDDTYQISVTYPNTDIFTTFTKTFINSDVHVSVVRTAGGDDNNFGVICRFQDPENFYAGQISSDGTAGIFKIENGKYQQLGNSYMVPAPAILGGSGKNELRFECVENTLTLSVNGTIVDTQVDDGFRSGEVGLIAGIINGDMGVFQFDDLRAYMK
jgi:hypothetical protein